MSTTSLALALFLFVACTGTLTGSAAASIKFPYASVDGPARYAGWVPTYTAAAAQSDLHRVTLYLTPSNPGLLDYLTTDDITKIVSPAPEAVKSVVDWLYQQGAATVEVARNRDAIVAMMPVHRVEAAFAVSLRRFVSPDEVLRPAHIASHIDLVSGLTDFPPVGSGKKSLIEAAAASTVPSSAALTPSVPVVTMVRARGGSQLLINFTPVCANGQYTKDAKKPCSEAPPAIAGFYVQINSTNPAVGKSKSEWLDSQCTFNGNYTTCTGSVKAWLYDALNVSVAAAFENDHVGPSGYNPYPVLATPPIVPQNIWKQYNIPPNTLVTTNVTQCVVEFEQQYYAPSDLTLFLEQTGLPTDTPVTVIGPNYPNQPGGEANLDIQYIMGVAPGAPTVFWSIYANSTVEIDDILQWALQMSNQQSGRSQNKVILNHSADRKAASGSVGVSVGVDYIFSGAFMGVGPQIKLPIGISVSTGYAGGKEESAENMDSATSSASINRWDAASGLGTPNFLELKEFVLQYPKAH
ncbi:Prokumamolisin, activation domain containing protein [Acanthamoeba castellanii str. Neff]|uniref:Prokumamolisin, activation domain containing protein n=1 Tax=Acanthamoeba castellanii (strain ATCC 30010 / Neff) TaxID=1257118 RepID=L8H9Y5_ACACF|nr:Prokumamolisin, activation domain containing protein [Acanthamoeba castellanii str. Neff]ELR22000.1 Prokumamolisin, activation domain containing protein [Acanthamoeba castellanii str. Neff]